MHTKKGLALTWNSGPEIDSRSVYSPCRLQSSRQILSHENASQSWLGRCNSWLKLNRERITILLGRNTYSNLLKASKKKKSSRQTRMVRKMVSTGTPTECTSLSFSGSRFWSWCRLWPKLHWSWFMASQRRNKSQNKLCPRRNRSRNKSSVKMKH